MKYDGLRGFLKVIDDRGELKRIAGASQDLEISAISVILGRKDKAHPALLFDEIKQVRKGYRVLTNMITTATRSKLALGIDPEKELGDPVRFLAEFLSGFRAVAPKEVSDGRVMENKMKGDRVDLSVFPAPKWHELDGGRYIGTGTLVVMRDPETGYVNMGSYRVQLHEKRLLGLSINPGHHGAIIRDKYWETGRNCPVVVSFGHDPRLAQAADMGVPWGASELDYAGWLAGTPMKVIEGPETGLPIPADSEVVVEGEVPPVSKESRPEGPFGEFGGYYSAEQRPQPVIRVKAVYFRDDPIMTGAPPFRGLRHDGVLPVAEAMLYRALHQVGFSDVKKIGRVGPFLVISMRPRYAGHARRVADFAVSGIGMRPPKFILMVDDDIDPYNADDVMWALGSRVDAKESIYPVVNRWGSPTDPRIPPEKKAAGDVSAASLIVDATRPWAWRDEFPKPTEFSEDLLGKFRKKWSGRLD